MPFDPSLVPDRLLEAVRTRTLIPFVGAGRWRIPQLEQPAARHA
ncbi:MAG TPA: hypothetical protein VFS20_01150 [Longimicrobium sp.]|nr:hypothetical protein [Longimicrobium sp.]